MEKRKVVRRRVKPKVKLEQSTWRKDSNYRQEYLKQNNGLFSNIWFCSQCGKILIGEKSVEADHIIPPSRTVLRHKNGKIMSESFAKALNSKFNLTAICSKCNKTKSDKMGKYLVKGTAGKVREVTTSTIGDAVALVLNLAIIVVSKGIQLLSSPILSRKVGPAGKFVIIIVYITIIYILFNGGSR